MSFYHICLVSSPVKYKIQYSANIYIFFLQWNLCVSKLIWLIVPWLFACGLPPTGALSYLFHPWPWKLLSPPVRSRPNIHQQFAFDKPSSEERWAFSSVHLVHWLDTNLATVYTVVSTPWKLCYMQQRAIVVLLEASIWSACHTTSRFRILVLFMVVCMLVLNHIFLIMTMSNRWGGPVRLEWVEVKLWECWADCQKGFIVWLLRSKKCFQRVKEQ